MNRLLVGSVLLLAACSSPSEPDSLAPTVASAATSQEGYQIDYWWNDEVRDSPTLATFREALWDAKDRWEEILEPSEAWDVPSGNLRCAFDEDSWGWIPGGMIDDLAVIILVNEIDGVDGTLARAAPCVVRYRGFLPPWHTPPLDFMPVLGMIEFDQADLAGKSAQELEDTILHELGHVLGLGTIGWTTMGLLQKPAQLWSAVYQDTHFSGWQAALAFDQVGGSEYLGFKVPVENSGIIGSTNGHWRQSVFQNELMTPYANPSAKDPISIVTLASLADIGYAVDYGAADSYQLPDEVPGLDLEEMVPHGGDILDIPIMLTDRRGEIVGRLQPGPVR